MTFSSSDVAVSCSRASFSSCARTAACVLGRVAVWRAVAALRTLALVEPERRRLADCPFLPRRRIPGPRDNAQSYAKAGVVTMAGHSGCRGGQCLSSVMRGLDPRIHVFSCFKTWMAGTSPAMTILRQTYRCLSPRAELFLAQLEALDLPRCRAREVASRARSSAGISTGPALTLT